VRHPEHDPPLFPVGNGGGWGGTLFGGAVRRGRRKREERGQPTARDWKSLATVVRRPGEESAGLRRAALSRVAARTYGLGLDPPSSPLGKGGWGPIACRRTQVRTRSSSTMAKVPKMKMGIHAGNAEAVSERMFWATKVTT
jgi:hypothetical protein